MPVLCEALSVVVRRDAIDQYYKGGWVQFLEIVPNATMCTDEDLVRVGFMSPQNVGEFIGVLESGGLQFQAHKKVAGRLRSSRSQNDIIVVDQHQGPTMPCDWIEFGKFRMGDGNTSVSFAWLLKEKPSFGTSESRQINEDQMRVFATPNDWKPREMLFTKFEDVNSKIQFLRTEGELDVFWDTEGKREVFMPRQLPPSWGS